MTATATMMPEIVEDDFESQCRAMSADDRREVVSDLLRSFAENLRRIAVTLMVMEELGETVPEMITAEFRKQLRAIASNTLRPEIVHRYFGEKIINKLMELPLHEQDKFIKDEPVEVAEISNGDVTKRLVPRSELPRFGLMDQVYSDDGRVRSIAEQARFLAIDPQQRSVRKTRTVKLPEKLYRKIEREAAECGISVSEVIASRFR